uniref:Sialin-like n=1 Tax=Cynoglossus semilaevis TaxID=244447 RepID=A0A3P8VED7_CYNSE
MAAPSGYSIISTHSDSEDSEPLLDRNEAVPPKCCSTRLNLAFLMFLGFAVVYGLRVNLSVAMVAMVNTSDPSSAKNRSVVHACPLPSDTDNTTDTFLQPQGVPQYTWDTETQGWLLGAFFFGYLCTQIPGGYLAGHYGGSLFLGLGVLGTAALTLLTPLAAQLGSTWLFALRAVEGFGEGVTFPAMMALPLTGLICQTMGWPAVFYLCGGAGCLWSVFWFMLVSDDPRTHRRISKKEKDYIINSIGAQGTGHGWSVPVLQMMMSVPLWAMIVTQMCSNWAYYTLLTSLPTYMDNILHFDLKSNGFLSALPYLGAFVISVLSGIVADALIEKRVFSVTFVRKLFTALGLLFPAVFLIAVCYVGCSHALTVTFLTLSTTTGGISSAGVFINQIDIAPRSVWPTVWPTVWSTSLGRMFSFSVDLLFVSVD